MTGAPALWGWTSGLGDPAFGSNIYVLNCHLLGGEGMQMGTTLSNFGLWGTSLDLTGRSDQGVILGMFQFGSFVGCQFTGGSGNTILTHDLYPTIDRHSLYRWLDFGLAQSLNFGINTNCRSDGIDTPYVLIDGCNFWGTSNGHDASNSSGNPTNGVFNHFVSQNNAFHVGAMPGGQGISIWDGDAINLTIRDNVFYDSGANPTIISDTITHQGPKIYRNKFYKSSNTADHAVEHRAWRGARLHRVQPNLHLGIGREHRNLRGSHADARHGNSDVDRSITTSTTRRPSPRPFMTQIPPRGIRSPSGRRWGWTRIAPTRIPDGSTRPTATSERKPLRPCSTSGCSSARNPTA